MHKHIHTFHYTLFCYRIQSVLADLFDRFTYILPRCSTAIRTLWSWNKLELIEVEWRLYASENQLIIGSGNGLSPVPHPAIILTHDGSLLRGKLRTNVSEIWFKIQFPYKTNMENVLGKILAILSRLQCVGDNRQNQLESLAHFWSYILSVPVWT